MKRFLLFSLFLILLSTLVFAEVSINEREEVKQKVDQIINYVNNGDFDKISEFLSPNAREGLMKEIEIQLAEKNIKYEEVLIGSYEEVNDNRIKASGSYKVKGPNWSGKGSLIYFTFEKSGNNLLLVDTNFHQVIFTSHILKIMGHFFLIAIPFMLLLPIFWIWMLIDCAKRNFAGPNDKVIWILIIIFAGMLGAIIYYFVVKRRNKR